MQSGALQQTGWMIKYLRSLTMQKFMASSAKRAAVAGTEYVLVRLFVPGALASSLTYLATSTAGTVGKNVVSYGFRASSADDAEVMVAIPKEEIANLKRELSRNRKWSWHPTELPSAVASSVKEQAIGTCTSVINLSYQDVSEGTGALIGSTAATAGMLYFLGPPTLIALPFYLLVEGSAKSVFAFIGKHLGRWYIGPKVFKPAIRSAWEALTQQDATSLEAALEEIEYQAREVNIGECGCAPEQKEALEAAWILFEKKPELQDYIAEPEDAPKPILHIQGSLAALALQDYVGNPKPPELYEGDDIEDLQAPEPKYLETLGEIESALSGDDPKQSTRAGFN